jgi:Cft2 family RNA processing exonuclease
MEAELPHLSPDVLIVESTYGVQIHEPRKDRETRFTKIVHETVLRGGRCLIPVFALGRAQELLLILDEYWKAHPDLKSVRRFARFLRFPAVWSNSDEPNRFPFILRHRSERNACLYIRPTST